MLYCAVLFCTVCFWCYSEPNQWLLLCFVVLCFSVLCCVFTMFCDVCFFVLCCTAVLCCDVLFFSVLLRFLLFSVLFCDLYDVLFCAAMRCDVLCCLFGLFSCFCLLNLCCSFFCLFLSDCCICFVRLFNFFPCCFYAHTHIPTHHYSNT